MTVIDSSGKTPSGFIDGFITSLGDYDQCLAISTSSPIGAIDGKYCLVDVFPLAYNSSLPEERRSKISLNKMHHFRKSAYYFSICLPSQCTPSDTRSLFKLVLKPFPVAVEGDISCDTSYSISWYTRLSEMKPISIAAAIYLSTIILLVIIATCLHVASKDASAFARSLSAIENTHNLFWVKSGSRPDGLASWMKMFIIFCGLCAHVMCCLESPIGFMMLSHHMNLKKIMSHPALIPLFGDAGIVCTTALAGFSTFMLVYPMALKGKLSIGSFVMNKAIRFIPSILVIMAFDVLWYLPFSGPFVSRVGQVLVDKCTDTWWKSALFINNLWGGTLQICSGHTYSLAVDVQLTVIGLIAIALMARKPVIGFAYCIFWIILGNSLMLYYSYKYDVPANLLVAYLPSIPEIEKFLMYIHMATSSYFASYFTSIIVAYTIYHGWWKAYSSDHILWLTLILTTSTVAQHLPILTNTFQLVPKILVPFFIVVNRSIVTLEMSAMLIYSSYFEFNSNNSTSQSNDQESKKNQLPGESTSSSSSPSFSSSPSSSCTVESSASSSTSLATVTPGPLLLSSNNGQTQLHSKGHLASESPLSNKFGSPDSLDSTESIDSSSKNLINNKSTTKSTDHGYYSLLKAFFRCSFAIYMVNYTYIRTDFFVSRNPFYTSLYAYVSILGCSTSQIKYMDLFTASPIIHLTTCSILESNFSLL